MEFKEYISKLEEFVQKDYSYDKELLLDIDIWSSMQSKEYLGKIESKGLSPKEAIAYLSIGFKGNYSIFLEDNSPKSYQNVIDDFSSTPIGNHLWKWINDYKHPGFFSKGFICDSLGMYMQIEHLNMEKKDFNSATDEIRGITRFMFPGVLESTRKLFKEGTIFHNDRDLANTIIALSKYIIENNIPARINLCSNYHYMTDTRQTLMYNPLGKELKYIINEKLCY